MDAREFIKKLSENESLKGEIHTEGQPGAEGFHPRFLGDYKNYYVKFDFIIDNELLFEVNTPPPQRLLVGPETVISKMLDKIKLSGEVKIDDKEFDAKYLIQNAPKEKAKKILNDKVKKTLGELEPFLKFEMTNKEYKLLRNVGKLGEKYTTENALADMDKLIKIVEECKKLEF